MKHVLSVLLGLFVLLSGLNTACRAAAENETFTDPALQKVLEHTGSVKAIASNPELATHLERSPKSQALAQGFSEKLADILASFPGLLSLSVLDENGGVVASTVESFIGARWTREKFPEGSAGKVFLIAPLNDYGKGIILCFVSVESGGQKRGTVVCTFFVEDVVIRSDTDAAAFEKELALATEADLLVALTKVFSEKKRNDIIAIAANPNIAVFLRESPRDERWGKKFSETLMDICADIPGLLNIIVFEEKGSIIASTLPDIIDNVELQKETLQLFPEAFAGKPFIGSPSRGYLSTGSSLGFAPVEIDGAVIGTVAAGFSLAGLAYDYWDQIKHDTGDRFALNKEGQVVLPDYTRSPNWKEWPDPALYKKIVVLRNGSLDARDEKGVPFRFWFRTDELLQVTIVVQAEK